MFLAALIKVGSKNTILDSLTLAEVLLRVDDVKFTERYLERQL
jgi:hypothetical protein